MDCEYLCVACVLTRVICEPYPCKPLYNLPIVHVLFSSVVRPPSISLLCVVWWLFASWVSPFKYLIKNIIFTFKRIVLFVLSLQCFQSVRLYSIATPITEKMKWTWNKTEQYTQFKMPFVSIGNACTLVFTTNFK